MYNLRHCWPNVRFRSYKSIFSCIQTLRLSTFLREQKPTSFIFEVSHHTLLTYELRHDKTNKMCVCPAKKAWVLSYPLSAEQRLWSDWADAQADPSLCWVHSDHFVGFVMSRLNYKNPKWSALPHSQMVHVSKHTLDSNEFSSLFTRA